MSGTQKTFTFVLSWVIAIALLTLLNRTRLGHVVIYYSLILFIFIILVSEYQQIAPLLSGIQSIGQLDASMAMANPTGGLAPSDPGSPAWASGLTQVLF